MRALAVCDGEHYAPVVRDALAALPYEVVGALAGRRQREAARRRGLRRARWWTRSRRAIAELEPEAGRRPLRRAGARAARAASGSPAACSRSGSPYVGPDFRFDPPRARAVSAAVALDRRHRQARRQDRRHRARGAAARARPRRRRRGDGPRRAARAGGGRGAADARASARALARRPARGLRLPRDGGARRRGHDRLPPLRRRPRGRAGRVERARPAPRWRPSASPELVIFDGSGAAIPPVDDRRARARDQRERSRPRSSTGYLNAYRILVSDLVVVTGGLDERARRGDPRGQGAAGGARSSCGRGRSRRCSGGGSRTSRRRRPRRTRRSSDTCARSTAPTSRSSPATSPAATRCATTSRAPRRRGLPGRDQGGRDRRRRRGGARARGGGGVRRQRARAGRRARPRRELRPRSPTRRRDGGGGAVTDRALPAAAAARRRGRAAVLEGADGAAADRRPGISTDRAYELALGGSRPTWRRAAARRSRSSGSEELAHETARRRGRRDAMRRLRRYQDLYDLDVPIILLVGGATGTGKSTVATDVAYRLGITRVTSTDFVRQTMRAFFSREFMPAIHYSSFEAGRAIGRRRTPTRQQGCARRLPRADPRRARRRPGRDRPRARGGLVDGARGRPPRSRDAAAADRGRARRPVRARDQRRRRRTRATSGSATPTPRACDRTRSTSTRFDDIRARAGRTSWGARESTRCPWSRTATSRMRSAR